MRKKPTEVSGFHPQAVIRKKLDEIGQTSQWLCEQTELSIGVVWTIMLDGFHDPVDAQKIANCLDVRLDAISRNHFTEDDLAKPRLILSDNEWQAVNGYGPMNTARITTKKVRKYHADVEKWNKRNPEAKSFETAKKVRNSRGFYSVATFPDGDQYAIMRINGRFWLPNGVKASSFPKAVAEFERLGAVLSRVEKNKDLDVLSKKATDVAEYFVAEKKYNKAIKDYQRDIARIRKLQSKKVSSAEEIRQLNELRDMVQSSVNQLKVDIFDLSASLDSASASDGGVIELNADDIETDITIKNTRLSKVVVETRYGKWFWMNAVKPGFFLLPDGTAVPSIKPGLAYFLGRRCKVLLVNTERISHSRVEEMRSSAMRAVNKYIKRRTDQVTGAMEVPREPQMSWFLKSKNGAWKKRNFN